jgi:hypothetical protein
MVRIAGIEAKVDQLPSRERNKQRVRQHILSAASELFKTRGYPPTTMDDIAEEAEISRATLFNHFPSKEALLLPWGQEIVEQQFQAGFGCASFPRGFPFESEWQDSQGQVHESQNAWMQTTCSAPR